MTNFEKYFNTPFDCAKSFLGENDCFHEYADWKQENFETVLAMKSVGFTMTEIMECWLKEECKQ